MGITVRLLSVDGALRATSFRVVELDNSAVSKVLPLPQIRENRNASVILHVLTRLTDATQQHADSRLRLVMSVSP